MVQRTQAQNASLHLWFRLKAQQLRDAGINTQMALSKTIELDMDEVFLKWMFKVVLERKYKKKSTTELEKHLEIDDIIEHINRYFAEKHNVPGMEMPVDENKIGNYDVLI